MKRDQSQRLSPTPANPTRRRLLAFIGLAGSAGVAWPHVVRQRSEGCRLLSLHEADFYDRHDLAG